MQTNTNVLALPYKLAVVMVAILMMLLVTTPAHAQGEESAQPAVENKAEFFDYVAERGNNLTLLVRRSLQLYDETNADITLSEPQIIYAETNIVQRLGSYQLAIGQEVEIPEDLVEEFANNSQNLTASQLAAWERYAKRADFTIQHINPRGRDEDGVEAADHQTDTTANDSAQKDKSSSTETGADQAVADAEQQADQGQDQPANDNGINVWWFVALTGVLGALWYIFRQRND